MTRFEAIYSTIADVITENSSKKLQLEDATLASYGPSNIPRKALLSIEEDTGFVIACFHKILNRVVRNKDVKHFARQLSNGSMKREELIEKLLNSEEYSKRGENVRLKK